jgi:hypothetical protein
MCITREAAHIFAATAPGQGARSRRRVLCMHDMNFDKVHDSPFGALRAAQLQALGIDARDAPFVVDHLLPPGLFADAGEERLLLDAARFLVAQRMFSPHGALPDAATARAGAQQPELNDTPAKILVLDDLAFFLDAQLRAAEARGQPLRDAFSFSGRTLASVTRLAAQHRRDALMAVFFESVYGEGKFDINGRKVRGVWHEPLAWDAECDRMLAVCARNDGLHDDDDDDEGMDEDEEDDGHHHCGSAYLPHADLSWPADEQLVCTANSRRTTTLRGEWCMQRLCTRYDIYDEGTEQDNCLTHGRFLNCSSDSSYWSLLFMPDAAGEKEMAGNPVLRQRFDRLRLTVHVRAGFVIQAEAACNKPARPAARKALAEWGRRAGVRVPLQTGDCSDADTVDEDVFEDDL